MNYEMKGGDWTGFFSFIIHNSYFILGRSGGQGGPRRFGNMAESATQRTVSYHARLGFLRHAQIRARHASRMAAAAIGIARTTGFDKATAGCFPERGREFLGGMLRSCE
jgi:hypothetical protein